MPDGYRPTSVPGKRSRRGGCQRTDRSRGGLRLSMSDWWPANWVAGKSGWLAYGTLVELGES